MKTVKDILEFREVGSLVSTFPESTVVEALKLLAKGNFGALTVVQGENLVGIFSERDYARKVSLLGKTAETTLISEIMTPNPICVTENDSLEHCMKLMSDRGFRHLPVVSNGKLLALISIRDAVKAVLSDKDALIDTVVSLSSHKQEEKERSFQKMIATFDPNIKLLRKDVDALLCGLAHPERLHAESISDSVLRMTNALESVREIYQFKSKLQNTKVLLATDNPAEEIVAKMALGGTGVELDTVSTLEAGRELLGSKSYDIICVNSPMIELAVTAREKKESVKTVFMTTESAETYVAHLRKYPALTNVVSQSVTDRGFTVKSILSTVGKIVNEDYFGMEKYLNWGAEIHEQSVGRSQDRAAAIAKMEEFCQSLGMRRTVVGRCANVAEELLMNAIYDAPVDAAGKQVYNHLERSVQVELKPTEQALFRYGCDGLFFGISVRDPFGALDREIILDYIESCFGGRESVLHVEKGGGGKGLFIIFRSGHLTVFNVKKGQATEVIVLFDLDDKAQAGTKKSSFHYFSV